MGNGVAVARNVLKVWLLLGLPVVASALIGWRLGGYRLGVLCFSCAFLLVSGAYGYADRDCYGYSHSDSHAHGYIDTIGLQGRLR